LDRHYFCAAAGLSDGLRIVRFIGFSDHILKLKLTSRWERLISKLLTVFWGSVCLFLAFLAFLTYRQKTLECRAGIKPYATLKDIIGLIGAGISASSVEPFIPDNSALDMIIFFCFFWFLRIFFNHITGHVRSLLYGYLTIQFGIIFTFILGIAHF
jgi:hypothetical protein